MKNISVHLAQEIKYGLPSPIEKIMVEDHTDPLLKIP